MYFLAFILVLKITFSEDKALSTDYIQHQSTLLEDYKQKGTLLLLLSSFNFK